MKEGLRCSGAIPYGYKRINGDKQTLVVDEPAAEIVRKVFRLACQGMGVTAIAEQLTEEKVLIPSAYTAKYFPENCRNRSFSDPYRWNANTIGHILDRQEYLGHTVLGKSICENFKKPSLTKTHGTLPRSSVFVQNREPQTELIPTVCPA